MEYQTFLKDYVDSETLSNMTSLVTLCRQFEKISLSFPLPSDEDDITIHYFSASEQGRCIGVAAVCLFPLTLAEDCNEFSYEITGFVHPDYRQRGIFHNLIQLFLDTEHLSWGDPNILFLSDRHCSAAIHTAAAWKMKQCHAQYLMKMELSNCSDKHSKENSLLCITRCRNRRLLAQHYSRIFQMAPDIGRAYVDMTLEEEVVSPFLIRMKDTPIGSGYLMQTSPEKAYLFSFGILPQYQGQGLGIASLHALKNFLPKDCKVLTVQVSGQNIAACKLYEKAGFVMTQQLLFYGWD